MKTYKCDSAFPTETHPREDSVGGLTKREWFAGLAMQGIIASLTYDGPHIGSQAVAQQAIANADALIKELNSEAS